MGQAAIAMTLQEARDTLAVPPEATPGDLRRAFREAAKRAHPDRPGGAPDAFHKVVEAYRRLDGREAAPLSTSRRRPAASIPGVLVIPALVALDGGLVDHHLSDGRRIRLTLPAGLRRGDKVAAGEAHLTIDIQSAPNLQVRGDDVWITVQTPGRILSGGGRMAVQTPLGRRIVWITRRDGERGLLRLTGQGLPSRGPHGRGHLFLRLTADIGPAQSQARTLLRRFAAAWAA